MPRPGSRSSQWWPSAARRGVAAGSRTFHGFLLVGAADGFVADSAECKMGSCAMPWAQPKLAVATPTPQRNRHLLRAADLSSEGPSSWARSECVEVRAPPSRPRCSGHPGGAFRIGRL